MYCLRLFIVVLQELLIIVVCSDKEYVYYTKFHLDQLLREWVTCMA